MTQVLLKHMFLWVFEVTYAQSSDLYLVSIYVVRIFVLVSLPPTTGHRVAMLSSFSLFTLTLIYACAFSLVSIYFTPAFHKEDSFSFSPIWLSSRNKPPCFG
jgi:hypothetical protein